jgi:SAM-dependent methyltransferase
LPAVAPDDRPPDLIDVRTLMQTYSIEELNTSAEEYFARLPDWDYLLAKPLGLVAESPRLLLHVAKLLQGLELLPDHRVLDFGAGSGWISRWLTQLGCRVYALDVSATALRIGARLFELHPPIGVHHPPRFIHFDGRRIPLDPESVDRIACFDAFHHLANPEAILAEMARVLAPGGIAGFSEPGPRHSRSPRSQADMKLYRTIENDIVLGDIARAAAAVGLTNLEVELLDPGPRRLSLQRFQRFLAGDDAVIPEIGAALRAVMADHHTFFLRKGPPAPLDSRSAGGLRAELSVVATRGPWIKARVRNTGSAVWLPTTRRVGAVHLGCHLLGADGRCIDYDFYRANLTPGQDRPLPPGAEVDVEFEVPVPPPGHYLVELDLVSEYVAWFVDTGLRPARVPLQVE